MKIGFLIPHFPSQTSSFIWREMNELAALGVDADPVSTTRPDPNEVCHRWSREAAERTVYLFPPNVSAMVRAAWSLLRAGPPGWWRCLAAVRAGNGLTWRDRARLPLFVVLGARVADLARRRGWAHLHVHSCADAAFIAMFARLIGGLPYSLTLHGALEDYGSAQALKWGHAAFGLTVTERLKRDVLARVPGTHGTRIDVAPMGVQVETFARSRGYAPPGPGETLRIVSCGRLHRGKGHHDLMHAVARLIAAGRPARLVVLGEGPARGELERLRDELRLDAELPGAVPEERVRDELERAHLFALASHDEAIGVATMEAMAMGLPVVVTGVGGVPELVRDGIDGILVPPRDPGALADAIARVADDGARARGLGASGAERVRNLFTSRRRAELLARRFGAVVSRPDAAEPVVSARAASTGPSISEPG